PRIRQIKIKTGVVKRIAKEKVVYEKEAEQQKNRIQKLKDEGQDEHNIRKQEEVLQESLMMVPDCQRRLVKAYSDLKNTLETEQDLKEHEDYIAAQQVLKDAESQLPDLPPNYVPPPPQPPPYFIPASTPAAKREKQDQEILKTFEKRIPVRELTQINVKPLSISEVREEIRKMVVTVNDLKAKQKTLSENISTLSDDEWRSTMEQVEENKALINKTLTVLNGPYNDLLQKLLAKRAAKRLQRSRKIDENLQKIKDDINKAKQEAEQKLQADMVLKEVLRKKSDAKKCLTKLDALVKLRKARQNTAAGRGETVSDNEEAAFLSHIEKLKSLWERKLVLYNKEEVELRAQLEEDSEKQYSMLAEAEQNVATNLNLWRTALFGGKLPQADFGGDVAKFIAVRSQWDRYISTEGSSLPVGWVPPTTRIDDKPA
ncbi:hypothetical protein HW555_000358, partial [Spodoptera exigua]